MRKFRVGTLGKGPMRTETLGTVNRVLRMRVPMTGDPLLNTVGFEGCVTEVSQVK